MAEFIRSRIEPNRVLHIIVRPHNEQGPRHDLCEPDQPLQASVARYQPGRQFPAHRHLPKGCIHGIVTQEAWVVIQGAVQLTLFDVDDTFLASRKLHRGDCLISLGGGHAYSIIGEEEAVIYEFKTGPYESKAEDKVMI